MKITLFNTQKKIPINPSSVRGLVSCILHDFSIKTDEVILHFVTKQKITELHATFFNDPSPTDCITFPCDPPSKQEEKAPTILGEVFICPQVAWEYAAEKNHDPYEELSLYVIHTLLHLLGYEDLSPRERAQMKRQERRCLKLAKEKNALITSKAICGK